MMNDSVNERVSGLYPMANFSMTDWATGEQAGNYLRFEILAPRLPCLIWRLPEW